MLSFFFCYAFNHLCFARLCIGAHLQKFLSPLYSTAVLTLNRPLKFVSSLSFMFFWWPKEPKAPLPALGLLRLTTPPFSHPVRCKLRLHYARLTAGGIVDLQSKFMSRKRHPSVGCCLPLKATRCHSGALGLVRFSVVNKITLSHFSLLSFGYCIFCIMLCFIHHAA